MKYKSVLGKDFELTTERKKHVLNFHPDLKPYFSKITDVFTKPDEIRISKSDPQVLLFYKYFAKIKAGKYIVGVAKINSRAFVLTAYFSNSKLSGEKYEYQKK
ncbi:MAG: hypothetical protein Q7R97_00055 [Candidatus Daviesbacteria bacterium]|nr:hypothetical protein [Candidatus Daviesbacteria bacterium]